MRKKVKKAIIPAAGFGTRFLPFTKAVPKELIPLVDKPVIQYVVEEAVKSGITNILIVTSGGKTAIQDHFSPNEPLERRLDESGRKNILDELRQINSMAQIHYVYQHELNGLGDAVAQAEDFVGDDSFAVLLGDTVLSSENKPVLRQLLDVYDATNKSVVALEEVEPSRVHRYGVISGQSTDNICYKIDALVEKPQPKDAPSNLVIASRYIFTPEIFNALRATPRGKGNEIQLTDAMSLLLKTQAIYGCRFDGKRHDVGNKLDFLKNTVEFGLKHPEFGTEFRAFVESAVKKRKEK